MIVSGATAHDGNPALKAVVKYPQGSGYANIARAIVTLPHWSFSTTPTSRAPAFGVVSLKARPRATPPAKLDIGFARAETPLLEKPLEGPVYLRVPAGIFPT